MNATGTNTAARISAIAITGPCTCFMAAIVASRGVMPASMWCSTASTTTMASSTTRPIASTRPNSDSVLTENPNSGNSANAPISETGTVSSGISVARQLCRNTNTTSTTSPIASSSVTTISRMPAVTGRVVSSETLYSMPCGKRLRASSSAAWTARDTSSAFDPGAWKMPMTAADLPLYVLETW